MAFRRFQWLVALERFHYLVALRKFHYLVVLGRFQCLMALGKVLLFGCQWNEKKKHLSLFLSSPQ
jgi:hypothetical protein